MVMKVDLWLPDKYMVSTKLILKVYC